MLPSAPRGGDMRTASGRARGEALLCAQAGAPRKQLLAAAAFAGCSLGLQPHPSCSFIPRGRPVPQRPAMPQLPVPLPPPWGTGCRPWLRAALAPVGVTESSSVLGDRSSLL